MTFQRVSHITMIVGDQDKAVAFYNAAFGTEVRSDDAFEMGGQTHRFVTVGIPGDDLEIALTPPMPGPEGTMPDVGDGNMTVVNVSDVDDAVEQVSKAGGAIASAPADLAWGRSAIIRDPDGNPWNLVQTAN